MNDITLNDLINAIKIEYNLAIKTLKKIDKLEQTLFNETKIDESFKDKIDDLELRKNYYYENY